MVARPQPRTGYPLRLLYLLPVLHSGLFLFYIYLDLKDNHTYKNKQIYKNLEK